MSMLSEFLDSDQHNIEVGKQVLEDAFPGILEVADLGGESLYSLAQTFGRVCGYDEETTIADKWTMIHGLRPGEGLELLKQATLIGNEETGSRAKEAISRTFAIFPRTYLLLRLQRDYLFGISDLLKNRVTMSMTYVRLQTESAALLALFAHDHDMAYEWLDAHVGESGKAFYNNHQRRIKAAIHELKLSEQYDTSSNVALHSRVLGVGLGILQGSKQESFGTSGRINLTYQEIANPIVYSLYFTAFMNVHARILGQANRLIPEAQPSDFDDVIERFQGLLNDLWPRVVVSYKGLREAGDPEASLFGREDVEGFVF